MKSFKKEVITIVALLVVAVIGIYAVNASTGSQDIEKPALAASYENEKISMDDDCLPCMDQEATLIAADDTSAASSCPCDKPKGSRNNCESKGTCEAWIEYDICMAVNSDVCQ